jgi:signal transduction histidine kinase
MPSLFRHNPSVTETLHAPAERETAESASLAFAALKARLPYDQVLELVPESTFIVNELRQVLFANAAARAKLGLQPTELVGRRPGELLGCVHSREMPGGCGTSEACRYCGAVEALLLSLELGERVERDCRIMIEREGRRDSLDLRMNCVPIESGGGSFALVTMVDISDAKRREVLERLFFHDLMNGLSSLQAGMFLVRHRLGPQVAQDDYFSRVSEAADVLVDEVVQQKQLFSLEKGDLEVEFVELDLPGLAKDLIRHVEIADYARGKRLLLRGEEGPATLRSDPGLLRRVILNMLKNALEASAPGEEVILAIEKKDGGTEISVHNPAYIPREYQLQIFQRSFSTKGGGRGIGTYSMKILTEGYLRGRISFTSGEAEGTTFELLLP